MYVHMHLCNAILHICIVFVVGCMSVSFINLLTVSFLLPCPAFSPSLPPSPTPQGTTFPFSACGHAFLPNADTDSPDELFEHNIIHTNMDQLVEVMKLLVSSCRMICTRIMSQPVPCALLSRGALRRHLRKCGYTLE